MRLRLLRKWENHEKVYPIGQIISVSTGLAKRMIEENKAEEYTGPYPIKITRRTKMKTDLFKPTIEK
jgi:hypothetical protein